MCQGNVESVVIINVHGRLGNAWVAKLQSRMLQRCSVFQISDIELDLSIENSDGSIDKIPVPTTERIQSYEQFGMQCGDEFRILASIWFMSSLVDNLTL